MKILISIVTVCVMMTSFCKPKQNVVTASTNADTMQKESDQGPPQEPKTSGKVSHQYRKTGCATVIIVTQQNEERKLILIPKEKLKNEFDTDGLEINFNYYLLKMPNPPGCEQGMPAMISDIALKK